jgi:hypothetical protein
MKRSTTGLSVRLRSVAIFTGQALSGNSTGNGLSPNRAA